MKLSIPDEIQKALRVAKRAQRNAHAPYSQFRVGAALLTQEGKIIGGCNVENASYGLTICAERNAFFAAIAQGHRRFKGIVIVSSAPKICPPCGACRQVMAEFFQADTSVWLATPEGIKRKIPFSKLLPLSFEADLLPAD